MKKKSNPKPILSNKENGIIRTLVDSYYGIQKARIETGNRVSMMQRDYKLTEKEAKQLHELMDDNLFLAEKNIKKELTLKVKQIKIFKWLESIKGIGAILSAGLISGIQSPSRFDTVSKLWRFCGLAVIDGKAEGKKKGQKIHYSPFLKNLAWKCGESFVKQKDGYRIFYDKYKAEYRKRFPKPVEVVSSRGKKYKKYSDGHIHAMAKRKAVKLFISHLFEVWRMVEGNPYRNPYCERLGHKREPAPNKEIIKTIA